ncbi:MAG: hypothetical protein Q8R14_02195 [Candidatus Omnitrophota bacterium]|nr:hypothetical protein [Candidatus Omnitrophota bacterium]
MMSQRRIVTILLLAAFLGLGGCSLLKRDIVIVDAKVVTDVDDKLLPVRVMDVFQTGASKVSCWFKWRDAKVNTQIRAKWHYITDDIPILDYDFNIPKKDGMGSVALTMPEDKALPQGSYKVDLFLGKKLLKSLSYKVE